LKSPCSLLPPKKKRKGKRKRRFMIYVVVSGDIKLVFLVVSADNKKNERNKRVWHGGVATL
jgi:hypothetical protein